MGRGWTPRLTANTKQEAAARASQGRRPASSSPPSSRAVENSARLSTEARAEVRYILRLVTGVNILSSIHTITPLTWGWRLAGL